MLAQYLQDTRNLLQNPAPASNALYTNEDLTRYINIARGQLAGEAECIRAIGTVPTVIGQRVYLFSAINTGVAVTTGVASPIHVRSVRYSVGDGTQWIPTRPWEWFELYSLNNIVPDSGPPQVWTQYAQGAASAAVGSAASGSFYVDPLPDEVYTLHCDCVCYPIELVDDITVEAIPYLWTDAVPFLAAAYALWSSQTSAREADGNRMFERYEEYVKRARHATNPSVLRWQYQQSNDPAQAAKFGMKSGAPQ